MSRAPAIAPPQCPSAVERRSGPIGFASSLLAHLLLVGLLITGGELFRGEDLGAIAVAEVTLISVSQFGALDPQSPDLPVDAPPTPPQQVRADSPPEAPQTSLPRPPPAPAPAVLPPQPPDRPAESRPLLAPAEPAPAQVAFAVPEPTPSPDSPPPPPSAPPEPTPPPPPVPVSRPAPQDTSEDTIAALESLLEQDLGAPQPPPSEQPDQETASTPRQLSGQRGALSDREYAYLRSTLKGCWRVNTLLGARNAAQLQVTVLVELSKDGSLVSSPELVSPNPPPTVEHALAYAEARRAVRCSAPYTGLDPANYSNWRRIELTFDPRGMMGQ